MRLRRFPGAVTLAWVSATALAVAVAWVGLHPVLNAAVPDRATPLTAADVRHLATPSDAPPAPVVSRSTPSASTSPPGSPTQPSPSASPGSATRSSARPSPSSEPATVVDGWTVTTQPDGSRSYLRSFQVRGGAAVIRMTPGRVYLVSATPNPDFSVEPRQSDPTRLVVQFTAAGRYDIIDAIWWNDQPYVEVSHVG